MLRSQGIPARLVVGFNTDEYNSVGGYYVARQLHAHAWVEALIDATWVSKETSTTAIRCHFSTGCDSIRHLGRWNGFVCGGRCGQRI